MKIWRGFKCQNENNLNDVLIAIQGPSFGDFLAPALLLGFLCLFTKV